MDHCTASCYWIIKSGSCSRTTHEMYRDGSEIDIELESSVDNQQPWRIAVNVCRLTLFLIIAIKFITISCAGSLFTDVSTLYIKCLLSVTKFSWMEPNMRCNPAAPCYFRPLLVFVAFREITLHHNAALPTGCQGVLLTGPQPCHTLWQGVCLHACMSSNQ